MLHRIQQFHQQDLCGRFVKFWCEEAFLTSKAVARKGFNIEYMVGAEARQVFNVLRFVQGFNLTLFVYDNAFIAFFNIEMWHNIFAQEFRNIVNF